MHVVVPNVDFKPESYRYTAFAAYYRSLRKALENALKYGAGEAYSEPVLHCELCRWWKECDGKRRQDDHLSFVAGASRLQRKELITEGISRLESLAKLPLPIPFKPSSGARDGYVRIREQARLRLEARTEGQLKFELLGDNSAEGLCRLALPSPGDIFLDLEGDPFVGEGGIEYLFGLVSIGESGSLGYQHRWAFDRAGERAAFEWLIDLIFERVARFPDLHVYHSRTYDVGAIKCLTLRYTTREEEVDRLLRGGIFIDLHIIVRKSVRASVEQYSLKEMEKFCGYERAVSLADAARARHFFEHQLELATPIRSTDEIRAIIEGYNQDDCRATERLRRWLEDLRTARVAEGRNIPRPVPKDTAPSEEIAAHQKRTKALFESLTKGLPAEPACRNREQAARWLLAHALDWHRREEKVKWWEFFRMKDLSEEELYDEKTAVAGLSHVRRMPKSSPRERAPIDRYQYPSQECAIRRGDTLYMLDEQKFGDVVADDPVARTIDLKKPFKFDTVHPTCAFAHTRYPTTEQSESILRLADWIVANGIDSPGEYRAARDLLLRNRPHLRKGETLRQRPDEIPVQSACRFGLALDNSVLPIQGPPGGGKTFTGARMICEMVKNGKKVGITAVSHKVIGRLLDEVLRAASEMNVTSLRCGHRSEGSNPNGGQCVKSGPTRKH